MTRRKTNEALDELLWQVLEQVGPKLPDRDRELVADFVEQHRLAIAVEWLATAMERQNLKMPSAAERLDEVRRRIGLESPTIR